MAREFAKAFYNSKAWRDCSSSFISNRRLIDGGMCQRCHERLGYIVHHKIKLTPNNIDDYTISLNHTNLEYVCHECHNELHDNFINRNRIDFDLNGDVVAKNSSSPHQKF